MKKSAREKVMDYLALRDHSRLELTNKLKKYNYSQEEIDQALIAAESAGWLCTAEKLAHKIIHTLNQRNKSHLYILHYLQRKGLPHPPIDHAAELEKALHLVNKHFSKLSNSTEIDKTTLLKQVVAYLKHRGFDTETISRLCQQRNSLKDVRTQNETHRSSKSL